MKKSRKSIGPISISGTRSPVGIAYIILPNDEDRTKFIAQAYRTSKVSIQMEDNLEIINNVKISKPTLQEISFPEKSGELGSLVVWVNIKRHNAPVIVGILGKNDDLIELIEDSFQLYRSSENSSVMVAGHGKDGKLFISVDSDSDGGVIDISLVNKSKTAKLNVSVKGDINLDVVGKINANVTDSLNVTIEDPSKDNKLTTIQYIKGTGLNYKDEFDNEINTNSDGEINLIPKKKFNVGNGKEPIPLGDELQKQLNKEKDRLTALINAIKSAAVVAQDGGASFKASIVASMTPILSGNFSNIKSKKGFTD